MKKIILTFATLVASIAFGMEPASDAGPDLVTFELPDNSTEKILKKFVVQSSTLKGMLEDTGNNTLPVPAPIQDSFGLMTPYFKFAYMDAARAMGKENEKLAALREKLAEHTEEELVKITNASTYLDIPLIRCEAIALLANRLTNSERINRCLQDGSYRLNTTKDILGLLTQEMLKQHPDLQYYWRSKCKLKTMVLKGHTEQVKSLCFSHEAGVLASAADDGIKTWNTQTGALIYQITNARLPKTNALCFNHTDTLLVSCHGLPYSRNVGALKLWNAQTGAPIGNISCNSPITAAIFNNDSTLLISGSLDGNIQFRNPETGSLVGSPLTAHTWQIHLLRFKYDGTLFASAAYNNEAICLWDPRTRSLVASFFTNNRGIPESLSFSSDGTILATQIVYTDPYGPVCNSHLDDEYPTPEGDPNTKLVLSIYNPITNTTKYKEFNTEFAIHSASLSNVGSLVASGNCRGNINLFNTCSGVKLIRMQDENYSKYHCNNINLCFNSNNTQLAAGTRRGPIKIIPINNELHQWFANGITADQVALLIFLKNHAGSSLGRSDEIALPESLELTARPDLWKAFKSLFS